MGTHVYANTQCIASKSDDGKSIAAFPDVCFSPPAAPVGPVPVPYSNTSEATDTDKGTGKVFIGDKMVGMGGDSTFSKSMGDEAATQSFNKGLLSSDLTGLCQFIVGSMDVQVEGKSAVRNGDPMTHNGQKPGNAAIAPYTSTASQPPAPKAPDAEQPRIILRIVKATWVDTDRVTVRRCAVECDAVHWAAAENNENAQGAKTFLESAPENIGYTLPYTFGFCQHPAVFCRDSAQSAPVLSLTLSVVSHKVTDGTKFDVTTVIEGCTLSGTYTHAGDGEDKTVEIFLRSPEVGKQFLRCASKAAHWKLENLPADLAKASQITGTTAHELYFVFEKPSSLSYANNNPIHVEAVRVAWLACTHKQLDTSEHKAITNQEEVVRAVTRYLFFEYGWTYDTSGGGRTTYHEGSGFLLLKYLTKTLGNVPLNKPSNPSIVNCVTQASAVHFICHAVGINMKIIVQEPFGYLKVTDIIGPANENCNNPFHDSPNNIYKFLPSPKKISYVVIPFDEKINVPGKAYGTLFKSALMKLTTDETAGVYARRELKNFKTELSIDTKSISQMMGETNPLSTNMGGNSFSSAGLANKPLFPQPACIGYLSSFGLHVFNEFDDKIYDACAGPAVGTHNFEDYNDAAINFTLNQLANIKAGGAYRSPPYDPALKNNSAHVGD